MKKSDLLRIKQIIMDSKDYLSFKNSLNLDNNSLFLCLLDILQEAIVDYNPINDYDYLTKAVLYLKSIYLELSKAKRDYYKKDINNLKKSYKKYSFFSFENKYICCIIDIERGRKWKKLKRNQVLIKKKMI